MSDHPSIQRLATVTAALFAVAMLGACERTPPTRWVAYYESPTPGVTFSFAVDRDLIVREDNEATVWIRTIETPLAYRDSVEADTTPGPPDTLYQKLSVRCESRTWISRTPPRKSSTDVWSDTGDGWFNAMMDTLFAPARYFWRTEWTEARPESREEAHLSALCKALTN